MHSDPYQERAWKISCLASATLSVLLMLLASVAGLGGVARADATPPINASGELNTHVNLSLESPVGKVQYDITGGTRVGTNLFHSFDHFSVPTNNIANFLNTPVNGDLPVTSNILGRVTGANPSSIFGTIQTSNFSNANLFLMNPAGFLFGPNAAVNVGGLVAFTSADYLKLTDDTRFNAIPNAAADALLTSLPVAAFGFLGSNPEALTLQGSQFRATEGTGISLIGGNISIQSGTPDSGTMQPAQLVALGGQINLVSVASSGEVSAADFMPTSGMTMGDINLSQGTTLDVSGNAAGTVRIRGGQFAIADATITADTGNASGAPTAVDINFTGSVSISNTRGAPAITARTTGTGDAGEVRIASDNLKTTSSFDSPFPFALIDTHTSGSGKGGDVSITTPGNLDATGMGIFNTMYFIDSGTMGLARGTAGSATITARNVQLMRSSINTGDFIAQQNGQDSSGSGGNVIITADTFHMTNSAIATDSSGGGKAGGLSVSARDVQINEFSFLQQLGINGTGTMVINANEFSMRESGQIVSGTALKPGGGVTITANTVELKNGSTIQSQTFGDGPAGDIRITATNRFTLSDDLTLLGAAGTRPSGLYTNSLGGLGDGGNAGAIVVTTPQLVMTGGARIDTTTQTNGHGGDVTITANSISMSGHRLRPPIEEGLFDLGSKLSSGIFTRTIGTTTDSGAGGNITLIAGHSVTSADGASISASSTGPGDAGDISINAGQQLDLIGNSSIKTEAEQASGGDIDIQAVDRVRLVNSSINTSVFGGDGNGGNITIDPNVVVLQGSQVKAEAFQGVGGDITITTPLFLADSTSEVSALSPFGLNGTVTIQSPTSNLSGSLGLLTSKPSQAQALLTQRCAALVNNGQASSFVVAGREQVPTDPGGWLSSPFAFATLGENLDGGHAVAAASAIIPVAAHDTSTVSLRRLTPAGFLMANFADSEATGCRS